MAAAKAGAYHVEMNKAYPRENEVPFDSERKRMITIHDVKNPKPEDASPFHDKKARNWDVIAVKGAPDVVLGTVHPLPDDQRRTQTIDAQETQGDHGRPTMP